MYIFLFQFGDAAAVANAILNSGAEYDQGKMMYNKYKSVVSYDTTAIPLFSQGKKQEISKCNWMRTTFIAVFSPQRL